MPGFDVDLYRNSLQTFIKIWKMLLIAASNSGAEESTGLFLHSQVNIWAGHGQMCEELLKNQLLTTIHTLGRQVWKIHRHEDGNQERRVKCHTYHKKKRRGKGGEVTKEGIAACQILKNQVLYKKDQLPVYNAKFSKVWHWSPLSICIDGI